VYSLSTQSLSYKKSAASILRSISNHTPHLATQVINSGALSALISCLEEFDPSVKTAAALVISSIAKHNKELA
jgi:hypothetical protein